MTSIIQDFKIFKDTFPKILDESGYKMDFLAKRIGLNPTTFSNKKKRNTFNLDEMQALVDIIWNDYLEEISLAYAMEMGQSQGQLSKKETQALFDEWK
jgi:hypothetical protein